MGRPRIVLPQEKLALLGKISDRDAKRLFGVSVYTVARIRQEHNIPKFSMRGRKKETNPADRARLKLLTEAVMKVRDGAHIVGNTVEVPKALFDEMVALVPSLVLR